MDLVTYQILGCNSGKATGNLDMYSKIPNPISGSGLNINIIKIGGILHRGMTPISLTLKRTKFDFLDIPLIGSKYFETCSV